MEKDQVSAATPKKFSDDLTTVYELVNAYRNRVNFETEQANKNKSKGIAGIATAVVLIAIGCLYAAFYFLPPYIWGDSAEEIRLVVQFVLLLAYIAGGAVILLQYASIKDVYKDFTGQIINFAADSAKDDAALFESFDALSSQSIRYVAYHLESDSAQLGQMRSFLLGAIEKVGIIPGLLATIFAISKVADSTGVSWIELLSFMMLGVYISMFPIFEASIKTKRISVLLNHYLELFRSDDELKETGNPY